VNEILPQTVEDFVRNLRKLRVQRNDAQKQAQRVPRKALTAEERMAILSKTGSRCHICGGEIVPNSSWDADHVQRHGGIICPRKCSGYSRLVCGRGGKWKAIPSLAVR
jgi:hypothetical protein